MQELIFGHLFANCGFFACVLLFCEEWSFRKSPEPGPQAGRYRPLILNGVLVVEIYCYISEQPQVILLGDAILLVFKTC